MYPFQIQLYQAVLAELQGTAYVMESMAFMTGQVRGVAWKTSILGLELFS